MAWHALIFSFRYLLTAPTHFYILTQTKLLGCSWRWYASRGSIVASHCGNHINMNTDPTFLNFTCAQYRMRNLAWWVQIMCTGLVASLVTGIPRRWGSKTIMSNDGNKTNRPLIINYSTVVCVLRNSFAMKWSCTLHPSKCNVVATAVGAPQVRCCR